MKAAIANFSGRDSNVLFSGDLQSGALQASASAVPLSVYDYQAGARLQAGKAGDTAIIAFGAKNFEEIPEAGVKAAIPGAAARGVSAEMSCGDTLLKPA